MLWLRRHAPVAQWIEHRIPVPRVGGSSPFRCTKKEDAIWHPLFWYIGRVDSKGRPERSEGNQVSGGHLVSPWESPSNPRRIRYGCGWDLNSGHWAGRDLSIQMQQSGICKGCFSIRYNQVKISPFDYSKICS